jgi:hypothetical protein
LSPLLSKFILGIESEHYLALVASFIPSSLQELYLISEVQWAAHQEKPDLRRRSLLSMQI